MRRALCVAAVMAVAGCSRCCGARKGTTGGPSVERVLPANVETAVVVPSLLALGEKLTIIEQLKIANFLAQLQNMPTAKDYVDAVVAQLGVDVRSKEALEKAGLDTTRPAGAVMTLKGERLLALPLSDETRFAALLTRIASQRLGTVKTLEVVEAGVTVHRLVAADGSARLEYVVANGYALVQPPATTKLSALAALPESESLGKDPAFIASSARLAGPRDLLVYLPGAADTVQRGPVKQLTIAAALDPKGLTVSFDAALADPSVAKVFAVAPQAPSLLGLMPSDAFLLARSGGDPMGLSAVVDTLMGDYLRRAFSEGGFEVKSEVLANLQPGTVLALCLAPTVKMGQGMPDLDLRRTNPFSFVHLSGAATAKNAEQLSPTLDRLASLAPKFGATITKESRDGGTVYVTRYAQGEGVHFTDSGSTVLFGSPLARLDALRAAQAHPTAIDPATSAFLEQKGAAVSVDLRKLAAAVKELPSEAWGLGGFAIKATTLRWLDATDDLKAITVGAQAQGDRLQGQLQLKLALTAH